VRHHWPGPARRPLRSPSDDQPRWQRDNAEDAGFIGYFGAAKESGGAVVEMLAGAERWLSERRAQRAIAPFIGAPFHGLGTLTDGFDEEPTFRCRGNRHAPFG